MLRANAKLAQGGRAEPLLPQLTRKPPLPHQRGQHHGWWDAVQEADRQAKDQPRPVQGNTTVVAHDMWRNMSMSAASPLEAGFEVVVSASNAGKISAGYLPIWIGDLTLACGQVCFPYHNKCFTPFPLHLGRETAHFAHHFACSRHRAPKPQRSGTRGDPLLPPTISKHP